MQAASLILAARFGGTPWQWRETADERDWGTGLALLEAEARQIDDMQQKAR